MIGNVDAQIRAKNVANTRRLILDVGARVRPPAPSFEDAAEFASASGTPRPAVRSTASSLRRNASMDLSAGPFPPSGLPPVARVGPRKGSDNSVSRGSDTGHRGSDTGARAGSDTGPSDGASPAANGAWAELSRKCEQLSRVLFHSAAPAAAPAPQPADAGGTGAAPPVATHWKIFGKGNGSGPLARVRSAAAAVMAANMFFLPSAGTLARRTQSKTQELSSQQPLGPAPTTPSSAPPLQQQQLTTAGAPSLSGEGSRVSSLGGAADGTLSVSPALDSAPSVADGDRPHIQSSGSGTGLFSVPEAAGVSPARPPVPRTLARLRTESHTSKSMPSALSQAGKLTSGDSEETLNAARAERTLSKGSTLTGGGGDRPLSRPAGTPAAGVALGILSTASPRSIIARGAPLLSTAAQKRMSFDPAPSGRSSLLSGGGSSRTMPSQHSGEPKRRSLDGEPPASRGTGGTGGKEKGRDFAAESTASSAFARRRGSIDGFGRNGAVPPGASPPPGHRVFSRASTFAPLSPAFPPVAAAERDAAEFVEWVTALAPLTAAAKAGK